MSQKYTYGTVIATNGEAVCYALYIGFLLWICETQMDEYAGTTAPPIFVFGTVVVIITTLFAGIIGAFRALFMQPKE